MAGPAGLAFRDVVRGAERVGDAVDAQIGVPTVRTPDDAAPGDVLATAPPEDASAHALGYLHINCGPCHNPTGAAWPDTDMVLQQSVFDADSAHSAILDTTVNVELQSFRAAAGALRLVPGAADASALVERMEQRGPGTQMPPLATEEVDPEGLALIRAWINAMPSTG